MSYKKILLLVLFVVFTTLLLPVVQFHSAEAQINPEKREKKGKLPIKLCLPLIFTWNQIIESLKQQRRSESRKKQAGQAGQAELHCTRTVE